MNDERDADQNVDVSANPPPSRVAPPENTAPTSQPATVQQLTNAETNIETRMSAFERSTLRWTRAMFAVTTATALFIAFQWYEMHDAGTQTEKIIAADERLAKAMENSVTDAENSYAATTRLAVLSQRAWMQVKIGIESQSGTWTVGQPLDVRIKQRNTGRTPALNLRSAVSRVGVEAENGIFKAPVFSYKAAQYVPSGNLTPDGEIFSDFVAPFTTEDQNRIVSMKVRIYIHGRLEYDDVFGVHHWLTFCSFLLPGQAFAICPYHNEMDQNEK
jgi:hypothetical protein